MEKTGTRLGHLRAHRQGECSPGTTCASGTASSWPDNGAKHVTTLNTVQADLMVVFRRIRTIKQKLLEDHPELRELEQLAQLGAGAEVEGRVHRRLIVRLLKEIRRLHLVPLRRQPALPVSPNAHDTSFAYRAQPHRLSKLLC